MKKKFDPDDPDESAAYRVGYAAGWHKRDKAITKCSQCAGSKFSEDFERRICDIGPCKGNEVKDDFFCGEARRG